MNLIFFTLLAFVVYLLLHLALLRTRGESGLIQWSFLLLVPFMILPFVLQGQLGWEQKALSWISSASLLSMWIFYVVCIVNVRNSVSLRMMNEIMKSPGGLRELEIESRYSEEKSVQDRFEVMVRNGWIRMLPNREVEITSKAAKAAKITLFFRKVFSAENAG